MFIYGEFYIVLYLLCISTLEQPKALWGMCSEFRCPCLLRAALPQRKVLFVQLKRRRVLWNLVPKQGSGTQGTCFLHFSFFQLFFPLGCEGWRVSQLERCLLGADLIKSLRPSCRLTESCRCLGLNVLGDILLFHLVLDSLF